MTVKIITDNLLEGIIRNYTNLDSKTQDLAIRFEYELRALEICFGYKIRRKRFMQKGY